MKNFTVVLSLILFVSAGFFLLWVLTDDLPESCKVETPAEARIECSTQVKDGPCSVYIVRRKKDDCNVQTVLYKDRLTVDQASAEAKRLNQFLQQ